MVGSNSLQPQLANMIARIWLFIVWYIMKCMIGHWTYMHYFRLCCRCTASLEDSDSFRPQLAFGGAIISKGPRPDVPVPKGRVGGALVPAAIFAQQVVSEVVGWSSAIPTPAAGTLIGEAVCDSGLKLIAWLGDDLRRAIGGG